MSSHGGQESFPFGYNQNNIHGIGLPDFMTPGPPIGQPLLNDDENANFNNFLSGFDNNQMLDKHGHPQQYQFNHNQGDMFNMPPTFVGSETTMGPLAGIDPAQLERYAMNYGEGLGTRVPGVHISPASQVPYGAGNSHGLQDNWSQSLFSQLNSTTAVQPGYSAGWQQQQLHAQGLPLQHPGRGPAMRFGSDSHFQPSGYSGPPLDIPETELQNLDWLESQPNTQPSSPNWSKKRKLNEYHRDGRNGFMPPNGQSIRRQQSSSHMKMESRGQLSLTPTPVTTSKPQTPSIDSYDQDEDAEAESDNDPTATNTAALPSREPSPPAPWPSHKARPSKSNKPLPPPKPSRKRKKSESASTPNKKSAQKARQQSSRVPLTHEQKKANHTNSEQRRRDATAKSYAELYDLVPEVAAMGKQSTMKKLEVVVDKVSKTIKMVEELRAKLGVQAGGSVAEIIAAQGLDPNLGGLMEEGGNESDEDDVDDGEIDDEEREGEGEMNATGWNG